MDRSELLENQLALVSPWDKIIDQHHGDQAPANASPTGNQGDTVYSTTKNMESLSTSEHDKLDIVPRQTLCY